MRKIKLSRLLSTIKNFKYGSMGIGALIVFIAMVLVAGIAASVVIQTSNNLESQAMSTGHETRDEVSSDIEVIKITGNFNTREIDGTNYSRFHNISIMVTPRSATSINLGDVIIQISNNSKTCILSWESSKHASVVPAGGLFSTPGLFDLNASEFGIIVIEDADGSCTATDPVINKGDKVALTINVSASFNGFSLREDIRGKVIGEHGSPGIFLFRIPASNSRAVVDLF